MHTLDIDVLTLCYYYCFKSLKAFRTEEILSRFFVHVQACHQSYCQGVSISFLDQKMTYIYTHTHTHTFSQKYKKPHPHKYQLLY